MAGFTNVKFLTPSHFCKPEENTAPKKLKDSKKLVLLPPSNYDLVEISSESGKDVGDNLQSNAGKSTNFTQTLKQNLAEKDIINNTSREEFLENELQKVKQNIRELGEEKMVLQNELQDKEALLKVVFQLKKDLKKSKEKLNAKEKGVSEKCEEYLNVIKCLR